MKRTTIFTAMAIAATSALMPITMASGTQDPAWRFLYAVNGRRVYVHDYDFSISGDEVTFRMLTAYTETQSLDDKIQEIQEITFNDNLTLDDITEDTIYNYRAAEVKGLCSQQRYVVEGLTYFLEGMVVARGTFDEGGVILVTDRDPQGLLLEPFCNPDFDFDD